MQKSIWAIPAALIALQFTAAAQVDTLRSGTNVTVRTNSSIDVKNPSDGRIYTGVVDQDVMDQSGRVAIPRGSDAELIVRNYGNGEVILDIESITVNGRRYIVSTQDEPVSNQTGSQKEGVGKNERTAKYVGGGAVLGTIIGAIAGGGKGAAIGAAAGAAAGAGTQTITRGRDVKVPAESLITFRLDRPLTGGQGALSRDNGYTENGYHYHKQYRYR